MIDQIEDYDLHYNGEQKNCRGCGHFSKIRFYYEMGWICNKCEDKKNVKEGKRHDI